MRKHGYTAVELVVIVTILAIGGLSAYTAFHFISKFW
jgi:Tfp pilus assembly protein PilE